MTKPRTLDELRQSIDPADRKLLDVCWAHYRDTGGHMLARDIDHMFKRRIAEGAAKRLTGNLLRRGHTSMIPGEVYELFYPGALACKEGHKLEGLLVRFLEALRSAYTEDHRIQNVSQQKLSQYLKVNSDELLDLKRLLQLGMRLFGTYISGSGVEGDWVVVVGDDIAELQDIDSVADYVQQYVVRGYDEGKPVPDFERSNWAMRGERSALDLESLLNPDGRKREAVEDPPDLGFMRDEALRSICLQTWGDALVAKQHGMFKAAVVLVGSVAEGLLLDYLEHEDADRVAAAAKEAKVTRPVAEMGLDEMVKVTTALARIPAASKHLAHFLREHRNTVHPARQRKERLTLAESDIDIAFAVLHSLTRHLSDQIEQ